MAIDVAAANEHLEVWRWVQLIQQILRDSAKRAQKYEMSASYADALGGVADLERQHRNLLFICGVLDRNGKITDEARSAGVIDPRESRLPRRYPTDNAPEESARGPGWFSRPALRAQEEAADELAYVAGEP